MNEGDDKHVEVADDEGDADFMHYDDLRLQEIIQKVKAEKRKEDAIQLKTRVLKDNEYLGAFAQNAIMLKKYDCEAAQQKQTPQQVVDGQIRRLQRISHILHNPSQALTESQEILLAGYAARKNARQNVRIALLGRPGTGKSYIVEIIADLEALVYGAKVVKCAYTGTCADRLKTGTQQNEAFTLHDFFGFKVHRRAHEPVSKPQISFKSTRFNRLNDLTSLFVDEVFQVSGKMFNYMQELIKECHMRAKAATVTAAKATAAMATTSTTKSALGVKEDDDWANKNVLVSGDPLQTIQFEAGDSIQDILLYKALDKFFLLDNKRHAGDAHWMTLMNELREVDLRINPRMSPEAFYTLASCFCAYHRAHSKKTAAAGPGIAGCCDDVLLNPRTTILVSMNSERQLFLQHRLKQIEKQYALVEFSSQYFDAQRKPIKNPALLMQLRQVTETQTKASNHPETLVLYVGARVMVLNNLSLNLSLTNGALATVLAISQTHIQIRVNKTGQVVNIGRMFTQFTFDGRNYLRRQFPLDIADVLTIHKCQGCTIDDSGPLVIVCYNLFTHMRGTQFYTAISRKTSSKDVHIILGPQDLEKLFRDDGVFLEYKRQESQYHEGSFKALKEAKGDLLGGLLRLVTRKLGALQQQQQCELQQQDARAAADGDNTAAAAAAQSVAAAADEQLREDERKRFTEGVNRLVMECEGGGSGAAVQVQQATVAERYEFFDCDNVKND